MQATAAHGRPIHKPSHDASLQRSRRFPARPSHVHFRENTMRYPLQQADQDTPAQQTHIGEA